SGNLWANDFNHLPCAFILSVTLREHFYVTVACCDVRHDVPPLCSHLVHLIMGRDQVVPLTARRQHRAQVVFRLYLMGLRARSVRPIVYERPFLQKPCVHRSRAPALRSTTFFIARVAATRCFLSIRSMPG
ncbi:MAG: hypothetical protein Q8M07_10335, partial [Prosthecobacter sp.]|nr:hypothetical protein [Prosthecobacter sp.]